MLCWVKLIEIWIGAPAFSWDVKASGLVWHITYITARAQNRVDVVFFGTQFVTDLFLSFTIQNMSLQLKRPEYL